MSEDSDAAKLGGDIKMDDYMQAGGNGLRLAPWLRRVLIGHHPKRTRVRILVLVVPFSILFILFRFVLLPIQVKGPSMLPTYHEGGINFLNRFAYLRSEPKRSDVVGIRLARPSWLFAAPSVVYMKRIVGLPGETIEFRDGHVLIDGKLLEEPYVKFPCDWDLAPEILKPNEYYLVGDNRSMPEFLHEKGRADKNRVVGKILLCKSLFDSSSPRH